jgi:hypothetical protein
LLFAVLQAIGDLRAHLEPAKKDEDARATGSVGDSAEALFQAVTLACDKDYKKFDEVKSSLVCSPTTPPGFYSVLFRFEHFTALSFLSHAQLFLDFLPILWLPYSFIGPFSFTTVFYPSRRPPALPLVSSCSVLVPFSLPRAFRAAHFC